MNECASVSVPVFVFVFAGSMVGYGVIRSGSIRLLAAAVVSLLMLCGAMGAISEVAYLASDTAREISALPACAVSLYVPASAMAAGVAFMIMGDIRE